MEINVKRMERRCYGRNDLEKVERWRKVDYNFEKNVKVLG